MTAHSDKAECPSASMTVGKPPLPLTILPFSPGPFSNRESEVVDLDGQPVAIVHKEDPAVRQADAQLLAASWDLFVALREYVLADQCVHAPARDLEAELDQLDLRYSDVGYGDVDGDVEAKLEDPQADEPLWKPCAAPERERCLFCAGISVLRQALGSSENLFSLLTYELQYYEQLTLREQYQEKHQAAAELQTRLRLKLDERLLELRAQQDKYDAMGLHRRAYGRAFARAELSLIKSILEKGKGMRTPEQSPLLRFRSPRKP